MDTVETLDKLKEVFTPVAEKIGQSAQYGWDVVIQQQYVYAYLGVFWAIVGLIVTCTSIWLINHLSKEGNSMDAELGAALLAMSICAIVLGLIMLIAGSITSITHFLNPPYYAIQFFLNLVSTN